ncbi:MAG: hypothetical protein GWM92_20125 [Gemmatimonadetes bacterium]|nr:hypothetical protein [Gemmatimonadota bacterium]NIR81132.1 hypothetical protein [Gemmatimonadota bacterium]NIT89956.1 hypothetical protein [Gemmatimonadota bacterium]NIU33762.1 hypothetical protein [Gemmatimonadota bacterium]NIU37996.1 hypothetical protein [Gemmatimonadota bacterium]
MRRRPGSIATSTDPRVPPDSIPRPGPPDPSLPGPGPLALLVVLGACGPPADDPPAAAPETLFSRQPPTWFEDGWSFWEVAPDGSTYVFGARFGRELFDAASGEAEPERLRGGLDAVDDAFFGPQGRLWRRGVLDEEAGWFREGPGGLERAPLPSDASPRFSPDGSRVAYFRGTAGSGPALFVGPPEAPVEHDLGARVTGVAWAPDGSAVYAATFREEDGVAEVHRADREGREVERVRSDLDGLARFGAPAVAADGETLYLALAGPGLPVPELRHRPRADRDTDLYRLDVARGELAPVVTEPGDDFGPQVVGDHLYWTHNRYRDVVAIVPITGGEPREIVGEAQIPYWRPDGRRIAFTVGGWALADWALNMDAWAVEVDEVGDRWSEPYPLITGYHEDFTPAWSPDGRWLAYHSHRSREPVSHYFADGGTDDIWIKEAGAPMAEETRLTDFGWEVGMADWDRTGTRLVFDSWERGGAAGVSLPWIATIDPETGEAVSIDRLPLPEGFGGTVLAAWSPVADELAVVERIRGRRHALWLVGPDGSGARRLFEFEASTYGGVDWTPDGGTLVYGALADSRMQLFAHDLARGESTQLTDGADDLMHPQVSPNGEWIAASKLRHVKELRRLRLPPSR